MIKKLAHLCIESVDLARTEWFYCDVLGMRKAFEFIRNEAPFGFYLEITDGNYIEVFKSEALKTEAFGHGIRHFCLEVEDIAAVQKQLQAHGIETTEPKRGADQSWQLWCQDPSGIRIEFHQYTDESSQRTGAPCIVNW